MKAKISKKTVKTILKVLGVAAIGGSAVVGAIESDEKTQELVKKLATKSLEAMEKKSKSWASFLLSLYLSI